jgi:hypothetical protein
VIEGVDADGSVMVFEDERRRVTLPPDYVAESVTLGYASPAMAGQGRNGDHSLVLVDGADRAAGFSVPMTRGRDGNDVWVVTDPDSRADAVDTLAEVMQRRWIVRPAIERMAGDLSLD